MWKDRNMMCDVEKSLYQYILYLCTVFVQNKNVDETLFRDNSTVNHHFAL